MPTLLLLRHGRTATNATGVLAGRQPVGLDEVGREQAVAVGRRLAPVPLAAVVSSPLPRCAETLELALPGRAVTVEERLTECGYGQWEGREIKELTADPLWPVVQQHPSAVVFPGGEAMAAMAARAVAAVREWDARVRAAHGEDGVWLACTHGDLIKAIVADALGLHLDLFQRIGVEPASITAIRYTATRPHLLRLSDTGDRELIRPARTDTPAPDAVVGGGS